MVIEEAFIKIPTIAPLMAVLRMPCIHLLCNELHSDCFKNATTLKIEHRRLCVHVHQSISGHRNCATETLSVNVLQLHLSFLLATQDAVKQVRQWRLHVRHLIPWGLAGKKRAFVCTFLISKEPICWEEVVGDRLSLYSCFFPLILCLCCC